MGSIVYVAKCVLPKVCAIAKAVFLYSVLKPSPCPVPVATEADAARRRMQK
jgi:hypothetical protein